MKRLFAVIIACIMLLLCASCGSDENKETSSIVASYSVKSENGDFIVEVQDLGGIYTELYDKEGIKIKFDGGSDKIYDKSGNKLSRDDLSYGDSLEIEYSGKLEKKSPKTIKAYKITKII